MDSKNHTIEELLEKVAPERRSFLKRLLVGGAALMVLPASTALAQPKMEDGKSGQTYAARKIAKKGKTKPKPEPQPEPVPPKRAG